MKEKILKVLNESSKSLDATEIMKKINYNYSKEELYNLLEALRELEVEALVVTKRNNVYMPFDRSNLKKGKIELTKSGNGFLLLEDEDMFISKQNLKGALDGDYVLCTPVESKGKKLEGKVKRILKRSIGNALAEICEDDLHNIYLRLLNDVPYEVMLTEYNADELIVGSIVKLESLYEKNRVLYVKIKKVVGHVTDPNIDVLKVMSEFDIETEFSEEVIEEVKQIPSEVREIDKKGRVDLTRKVIVTIDGDDTKDIDDAISLEILENGNYLLGVHIANVSYYVKEGSKLREEAKLRGNSVYAFTSVVPMLPRELSNGICSLNPGKLRCALSINMEINNEGHVVNKKLFRSLIKSNKKMTYNNVNKVINGEVPKDYEEYKTLIDNMHTLSLILKKERDLRGNIDFVSAEPEFVVDDNNKILEIKRRNQDEAEEIIENFMIIANETVGAIMENSMIPSIYRVHGTPSPEKIKEFLTFLNITGNGIKAKIDYNKIKSKDIQKILYKLKDSEAYSAYNNLLLRCMQKAVYSYDNIGHFGLASKCYAHFTAPIRRFSDLYLHYIIEECILNNPSSDTINNIKLSLPFITEHVSKTERNADNCEHEVDDMKIAEYMEGHIGEEFTGRVDGLLKSGFFVLTDNLISGLVKLDTIKGFYTLDENLKAYVDRKKHIFLKLGDEVRVKCVRASKEERKVDFVLVNEDDRK